MFTKLFVLSHTLRERGNDYTTSVGSWNRNISFALFKQRTRGVRTVACEKILNTEENQLNAGQDIVQRVSVFSRCTQEILQTIPYA